MNQLIEYCREFDERLKNALEDFQDLNYEKSFEDSEDAPYRSKYAARANILKILTTLVINDQEKLSENVNSLVYCFMKLYLANNFLETDEKFEAREIIFNLHSFIKSEQTIDQIMKLCEGSDESIKEEITMPDSEIFSVFGGVLLYSYCIMGLATSGYEFDENDKNSKIKSSLYWFQSAQKILEIYDSFKISNSEFNFQLWESNFLRKNFRSILDDFLNLNALTLEGFIIDNARITLCFMLAQTFLKNDLKNSAGIWCAKTLSKTLELEPLNEVLNSTLKTSLGSCVPFFFFQLEILEPLKWASNCASLANYFSSQSNFFDSAECLFAAKKVFNRYEQSKTDDQYLQVKADIKRSFANHCQQLLKTGISNKEPINSAIVESVSDKTTSSKRFGLDIADVLKNISLDSIESFSRIPSCYQNAVPIFRIALDSIKSAQTYYVEDGRCSEFVELERNLASIYGHMAQFETDYQRKCCILKNKVDILSKLVCDLNSQHYLLTKRVLFFELGDAYCEMKDAKQNMIDMNDEADFEEEKVSNNKRSYWIKKCNKFSIKAIESFQKCIDTFKEPIEPSGKVPEKFEVIENYLTIMRSNFYMARLYANFLDTNSNKNLEHLTKALELYQKVLDLAKVHGRLAIDVISDDLDPEVEISRTMLELLPKKMDRIRACL